MAYTDHYKLVDDVTHHFDAVTSSIDAFILSRYVGFFAVASTAVIELAYKEIILDFAERTHPTFGSYFSAKHEQINARVKLGQINNDFLKPLGGSFCARFNRLVDRIDDHYLRKKGFSVKSSYGTLIMCRHDFSHAGIVPPYVTYAEIKNGYEAGKIVLACLAKTLKDTSGRGKSP